MNEKENLHGLLCGLKEKLLESVPLYVEGRRTRFKNHGESLHFG